MLSLRYGVALQHDLEIDIFRIVGGLYYFPRNHVHVERRSFGFCFERNRLSETGSALCVSVICLWSFAALFFKRDHVKLTLKCIEKEGKIMNE